MPVVRKGWENTLQIVQQALFGTACLSRRIGETEEIRAHHLAVRIPCRAGHGLELHGGFLNTAEHHGGSKGGKDGVKPTACRHLNRRPAKARDIDGRMRLLYWSGQHRERLQHLMEFSCKGKLFVGPGFTDELHLLVKALATLVKGDGKGIVLALVITATS